MSESVADTNLPPTSGIGEDPLLYWTKMFVRFLQLVFATNEKGNYKWEPDDKLTDIYISDSAQISNDVVNKTPAILVKRGGFAFMNLAMDQLHKRAQAGPERIYSDLVSSSVTFNCISREGLEAGRIAWFSMMAVRRLKRTLNAVGAHRVGEDLSLSDETPPGALVGPGTVGSTMVSVNVPFLYQDTWKIEPTDKTLLRKLDITLTSSKSSVSGGFALRAPQFGGRPVGFDQEVPLSSRVRVTSAPTPKPRK